MAPPPPSQKGMFRPKKQKKAIRPGAAVTSSDTGGDATRSAGPTVAFAPTATDGSNSAAAPSVRSSFGRGGPGRGRGGGRGRAPTPQGRVFFQGGGGGDHTQPSAKSGSSRSGSGRTSSGGSTGKKGGTKSKGASSDGGTVDLTSEEVVGELDVAVGGNAAESAAKKKSAMKKAESDTDAVNDMDYDDSAQTDSGTTSITMMKNMYTYDSDSSDEGDSRSEREQGALSGIQPLELPFVPASPVPMEVESAVEHDDETEGAISSFQDETPASSPFVDVNNNNELVPEKDAWFLVQLPTRLPPLKKKVSAEGVASSASSGQQPDQVQSIQLESVQSEGEIPVNSISDVVTPPMLGDAFDNQLATAEPGKIGKILVYKSGKTVLVMEGQGGEEIRMEVNEGLTCAFRQEAVFIDAREGGFISLGDVKKSVVVSPDMNSIMGI